MEAVYHAEGEE
jgi:hypothetical protein